jgi:hypothetical protein
MYPKTLSGLVICYTAGVPFFRATLESDLFFTIAMFEIPVLMEFLAAKLRSGDHPAAA